MSTKVSLSVFLSLSIWMSVTCPGLALSVSGKCLLCSVSLSWLRLLAQRSLPVCCVQSSPYNCTAISQVSLHHLRPQTSLSVYQYSVVKLTNSNIFIGKGLAPIIFIIQPVRVISSQLTYNHLPATTLNHHKLF